MPGSSRIATPAREKKLDRPPHAIYRPTADYEFFAEAIEIASELSEVGSGRTLQRTYALLRLLHVKNVADLASIDARNMPPEFSPCSL
jgi:hypothetical protein